VSLDDSGNATSSQPGGCCSEFSQWPNVDNGVTCGDCTALVLTDPYGGRCDRYCESFGHVCVAAAEERAENCEVKHSVPCSFPLTFTSDMLCKCSKPRGQCGAPAPSPAAQAPTPAPASGSPAPAPAPAPPVAGGACCKPFSDWPNVDGGVTCGGCTALVKAQPYGGRCDRYCESFGQVCVAAAEETNENCEVSYSSPCDVPITGTSDILCTCQSPDAGATCPTPTPPPTRAPGLPSTSRRIEVRGRQVLVDGVPVHLKGVAWNPVPRGSSRVDFRGYVEQDAALMKQAGINAVRTYSHISDRFVLDTLWVHGIWVLDSVYNYGGDSTGRVAAKVNGVKDHPAILMWTIGNEWNYNGLYVHMGKGSSRARVADVARIVKANDRTRPVASIYGEVPSTNTINSLPDIDVWGINVYRGISFDNVIEKFAAHSGKPLFFGEYGADAYNANIRGEDQAAQAKATRALTEEIVRRSAVHSGGTCIGGFVFEWADEWWKDGGGSSSRQDVGGVAPGGGPYPDRTFNEEWWGLVDIDRKKRLAYDAFAQVPVPTAG